MRSAPKLLDNWREYENKWRVTDSTHAVAFKEESSEATIVHKNKNTLSMNNISLSHIITSSLIILIFAHILQ